MKPKFMLDTNICIYLMKRQPPEVAARLQGLFVGEVVMSAVTLAELEYGVACSGPSRARNRDALDGLLTEIPVVAFDQASAAAYGPARLATRERSRDALDKLIAAHALALGAVLVTNNEADFAAYPGLKVENWAASA